MTTREKTMVGLTLLVALAGGAYLFNDQLQRNTPGSSHREVVEEARRVVEEVRTQLATSSLDDRETYILAHAAAPWAGQPFVPARVEPPAEEDLHLAVEDPALPDLTYSCYLRIADRRLAVIDGHEYAEGDRILDHDFIVQSIRPEEVILQRRNSSQTHAIHVHPEMTPGSEGS